MTSIQKDDIREAFEDVRNDTTDTTWLVCKYRDNTICLHETGANYEDLLQHLGEDERAFVFVRVIIGDELSKRAKFALITWVGKDVGGLKRAKIGTDKSLVKTVITSFAAEIRAESLPEATLDVVKETLKKAGGANYGTGVRD